MMNDDNRYPVRPTPWLVIQFPTPEMIEVVSHDGVSLAVRMIEDPDSHDSVKKAAHDALELAMNR